MDNKYLRETATIRDKEAMRRICSIYKILVSAGITFKEAVYELGDVKEALKDAEIKNPSE